jgi:hypothetical protein
MNSQRQKIIALSDERIRVMRYPSELFLEAISSSEWNMLIKISNILPYILPSNITYTLVMYLNQSN